MRVSPFGSGPSAFFTAVTLMGPQRLHDPDWWDGGLLVVSKVVGQTGTYVCLSDHTYIPTLVNFTTNLGKVHVLDPISDQRTMALNVVQARPFNLEELIQRLAEFAVENKIPITDDLVTGAVNLWYNARLLDQASVAHQLKGVYAAHHLSDEEVLRRLNVADERSDLRNVAVQVVSSIAKDTVRAYTQQV